MMKLMASRLRREERGFTLIELMVVVLIIAILIAIAIPTFLGARKRAQDRAAQSSLRNALTAAKTIFTDNEDYTKANSTALSQAEPSLTFVDAATASGNAKTVSVNPASATVWAAAAESASGTCFYIKDDVTATPTPGPGTKYGKSTTDPCTGEKAATLATDTQW